jgi:hypothetical protein
MHERKPPLLDGVAYEDGDPGYGVPPEWLSVIEIPVTHTTIIDLLQPT